MAMFDEFTLSRVSIRSVKIQKGDQCPDCGKPAEGWHAKFFRCRCEQLAYITRYGLPQGLKTLREPREYIPRRFPK